MYNCELRNKLQKHDNCNLQKTIDNKQVNNLWWNDILTVNSGSTSHQLKQTTT